MNLAEIKAYLEANKDSEDVKQFVAGLSGTAEITLEAFKTFASTNDDAKAFIGVEFDKGVTHGRQKFEENSMPAKIKEATDALRKELNPEETDAQKQNREFRDRIEALEKEKVSGGLKANAITRISKMEGMPQIVLDSIDLFIGTDEDSTNANIDKLKAVIDAATTTAIAAKFKEIGQQGPGGGGGGNDDDLKGVKNPWMKGTADYNLTEQGKIQTSDPDLAKRLRDAAK